MTDDRAEMKIARDAGLVKRHEQRLARATGHASTCPVPCCGPTGDPVTDMVIPPSLAAEVEPWLQQCGSCDAGLPMGCTCPQGDYRNILLKVWHAYEAQAADTKALVETATRLGRELGRREAAEEAAKLADELAAGVVNPEKPYNEAFVHACGVVARHIREIATEEPK